MPAPRIYVLTSATFGMSDSRDKEVRDILAMGFDWLALKTPALDTLRACPDGPLTAARQSGLRLMAMLAPSECTPDAVAHHLASGIEGFVVGAAHHRPAAEWRSLIAAARAQAPTALFCADALGADPAAFAALAGAGFDFVLNSVRWWDGREPWFLDQWALSRQVAPSIGFPDYPGTQPLAAEHGTQTPDIFYRSRYLRAAALGSGIAMPRGYETAGALHDFIAAVNRMKAEVPSLNEDGPILRLSPAGAAVTALIRWTQAQDDAVFVLINTDEATAQPIEIDALLAPLGPEPQDLRDVTPGAVAGLVPSPLVLRPDEVRVLHARRLEAETVSGPDLPATSGVPRIIIERIWPELDGGRFPVKRIQGDMLEVWADIFRDGHDRIAAALWVQHAGTASWTVVPMHLVDNNRWVGRLRLDNVGRARFAVEAWTDAFGTWREDTIKKRAVGQDIALELQEGRELLRGAAGSSHRIGDILQQCGTSAENPDLLLSARLAMAMACLPDKTGRVFQDRILEVQVDREAARCAAWYEMFPRSQGTRPDHPAQFADCIRRLPEIRDLGFDVVYLVPIHPIGRQNRKGRDNSLVAGPDDPGSPYAIGSALGGHTAIDPELGTLDDFRDFVNAVQAHGMEVAMDFAVQCAPDHPWLTEHPNWFRRRIDGSIKFAENPPKKYEDIVNLDFDQPGWPALWDALRDIVLFWIGEGVRIFRVDNPHTKPAVFWQWLIDEVQRVDPGVLFLAEAFTHPKMMRRLGKIGFSQSYTYFTWRDTKAELTGYLTELTRTEQKEYYRPLFFPNTPDILPWYLQTSGRAGFRIRLVLAATLSPAYGIYNGFELCEAEAVPGKEEYAHSEKYRYKAWDWDRPGHIKQDIARINRLRRTSPALRLFDNLRFHEAGHGEVLFYSKIAPDRGDAVLVAVSLNPHHVVRTEIVFPLDDLGLGPGATFETTELFTEERRQWTGARQWIVLEPETNPAMILRYVPPAKGQRTAP